MNFRNFTKFAVVSAVLIAPVAQAHAYSIHKKNGEYKIECDNGVTSQGSSLQISHAEAEHFCKVRGSSISTNPSSGGTTPPTAEKAKDIQSRAAQTKK